MGGPATLEPLTPAVLAGGVAIDPTSLVLTVVAAVLYAIGVRRLARRGRRWPPLRSLSFAVGIAVLLVATQSRLAAYDTALFSAHVAQHVLLGVVAPLFLALGAPVTLALQASRRGTQVNLLRVIRSRPVRVIGHPVVAFVLFSFTLFALYFSPLYELSLRNDLVHAWTHIHFVVVGSLFFWVTIGLDPVAHRIPYGARLLIVALTVPFHAFLGIALLSSARPLAETFYRAAVDRPAGVDLLADQHAGATIMWLVGDLIGLVAGSIVLAQWMRHEQRQTRRLDRELDERDAARAARDGADRDPSPAAGPPEQGAGPREGLTYDARQTTRDEERRARAIGRRDDEANRVSASDAPRARTLRRRIAVVATAASAGALAGCGSNMGLPDSATSQGEEVISLWQIFLTLAIIVAGLVWILVLGTIVASVRRRRQGGAPDTPGTTDVPDEVAAPDGNGGERGRSSIPQQVQYRTRLELVLVAVPIMLVLVLLGLTFRVDALLTETTEQPDLVVEVTGFQWQWQFRYPDLGVTISGDPEDPPVLYLPVGRTIRFKLLADDVIHSFWVPEFLEKRDMVPGVTNEIEVTVSEPGTWVGRCAEYCGLNHWQMWFDVNAVAADQFDTWAIVTARQPQPVVQGRARVTSTTSSTAVPITTPPPSVSIRPTITTTPTTEVSR